MIRERGLKNFFRKRSFLFFTFAFLLSSFLFVFSLGAVLGDNYFGNSLDNGLISMWTMDASDGSTSSFLKDVVGNNDGTVIQAQQVSSDIKGEAYDFDGVNDYVALLNRPSIDDTSFSVCFWANPVQGNRQGYVIDSGVYQKGSEDMRAYGWGIKTGTDGILLRRNDGSTSLFDAYTNLGIPQNTWKYVCAVYDKSVRVGEKSKIYINSISQALQDDPLTSNPIVYSLMAVGAYLGVESISSVSILRDYFKGKLDEIGIWNRSLNPSEVSQLYNSYMGSEKCQNRAPSGLVSYWGMDASDGSNSSVAVDVVFGNNGTVNGLTQVLNSGVKGDAYRLSLITMPDGYRQFEKIQIQNSNNLIFHDEDSITLGGWIYFSGPNTGAGIINKNYATGLTYNDGNVFTNFDLHLTATNRIGFQYRQYSDCGGSQQIRWNNVYYSNPLTINQNTWYYILVTYNYSSNVIKTYFNGNLISGSWQGEWSSICQDDMAYAATCPGYYTCAGYFNANRTISTNAPVFIASPGTSGGTSLFLIDEVGLWNRSLNPSEITSLYNCYMNISSVSSGSFWSNLKGEEIIYSQKNDTVKMNVFGSDFAGKEINYTIYKGIAFWWDKLIAQSSSFASSLWKAGKKQDGSFDSGDFYFKAKVGSDELNKSRDLSVSSTSDNSQPTANIVLPSQNSYHAVNKQIDFTQSSYDEDDLLKLTWNFGDGNTTVFYNYSLSEKLLNSSLTDTKHNYSIGGRWYTITLNAQEMERGQSNVDSVDIYVFKEGINVVPIINSPSKDLVYENWVNFNASQSFVANCTRGAMVNYNFTVEDLNCSYIHWPRKHIASGENYDLLVNWTIYNTQGQLEGDFTPVFGSWKNNYSSVSNNIIDFYRYFMNPSKRTAFLSLNYVA